MEINSIEHKKKLKKKTKKISVDVIRAFRIQ